MHGVAREVAAIVYEGPLHVIVASIRLVARGEIVIVVIRGIVAEIAAFFGWDEEVIVENVYG